MNQAQRDGLMNLLFSPETGIGASFLRIAMGASDFTASGRYTYNDLQSGQTDVSQTSFSIAHDQQYIVPQLQQAKVLNPNLNRTNQTPCLLAGKLSPAAPHGENQD